MKKLFTLLAAVALIATFSQVSAQSTGTKPAPGAMHNYSITSHEGGTVVWSVVNADMTATTGVASIASATAYSTDITWADGLTAGTWYFVQVVETVGGCSNTKVLPVQITASPFNLTLSANNATACYNGAVSVSIDMTDADNPVVNYDHGSTTVVFTVTPAGLSASYTGYSFDVALSVPGGYTSTAAVSGNATIDSGTVTVNDNAAVTITYTIDNTNTYTNTSAANAADFTATASISNGKAINGVSDNTSGTYSGSTAVARPHTSGITTN